MKMRLLLPSRRIKVMTSVHTAIKASAKIITFLRSQRSIYTPAKGPIKACGSKPAIAENASTSADLYSRLSQMITAKLTAELLSKEINCPVHIYMEVLNQCLPFIIKNHREP